MIITIRRDAPQNEIIELTNKLNIQGTEASVIKGNEYDVIAVVGDTSSVDEASILVYPWVLNISHISSPYKLVSREYKKEDSIVNVNGIEIGSNKIVIMAGPCSVEGYEGVKEIASFVKENKASVLRGGAYKPRTSPYNFQGLGDKGIDILKSVKADLNIPVVSEILSVDDINRFVDDVDIIQVGARNMQNYELLKALGKTNKPILLKRGMSNTVEEWLLAAEYIVKGGNNNVILCERGIRTFEKSTRNTLDLSIIGVVKKLSHLPVIVDPSHATGRSDLAKTMALAAIVAGADGLLLEVHNDKRNAISDANQAMSFLEFEDFMAKAKEIAKIVGRSI